MEKINRKDNEVASLIEEFISQENSNIKLIQEEKYRLCKPRYIK